MKWLKDEIVLVINQDSRRALPKARQLQKLAKQHHLRTVTCEGQDLDYTIRNELKNKKLKRLIIAGGDGSITTAVSIIIRSKRDIDIGVIPVGTANYYARTLNIKSVVHAFNAVFSENVEKRFVCEANGRIFMMVANAGAVSRMFDSITDIGKKRFGKFAYAWGMLKMFISFDPMRVSIQANGEKKTYATTEIQVINQSIKERIHFHPEVDSREPYFEIVTFGLKETKLSPIFAIIILILSLGQNQKYLRRIRATEATIEIDRDEVVSLDGDSLERAPIVVKMVERPIYFVHP